MAIDHSLPGEPSSLVDSIVDRLEQEIIAGALTPGSKLSEIALATSLGVSRGPLREALQRLVGRRLVIHVPNSGARVISLTRSELSDMLLTREALEGTAARLAAERMTLPDISWLYSLTRSLERSDPAREQADEHDNDFHRCVARGSRSRHLIDLLCKDLYYVLKLYRRQSAVLPGRRRSTVAEHLAVADAIAARDPERAEQMMRVHIRNGRERLLECLRREDATTATDGQTEAVLGVRTPAE